MGPSPRIAVLAILLLVLPAAFTALFLARHAHPAVAPAAQPGGRVVGRLEPRGAVPSQDALAGVEILIEGLARDGARRVLARATTAERGRFEVDLEPIDGHYEARVPPCAWLPTTVPFSLAASAVGELRVPVRAAAILDLAFERRSGVLVRGGSWSIEGETERGWFSPRGARFERQGTFAGATLVVPGLHPGRVSAWVRFDGGGSTELVVDLVPGPNHARIEL